MITFAIFPGFSHGFKATKFEDLRRGMTLLNQLFSPTQDFVKVVVSSASQRVIPSAIRFDASRAVPNQRL
jgi:hypothetical protein